jgi:hypothetical protein
VVFLQPGNTTILLLTQVDQQGKPLVALTTRVHEKVEAVVESILFNLLEEQCKREKERRLHMSATPENRAVRAWKKERSTKEPTRSQHRRRIDL